MNVRIRGIYATALSILLPAHGFAVVDASPVIAERLSLPTDRIARASDSRAPGPRPRR